MPGLDSVHGRVSSAGVCAFCEGMLLYRAFLTHEVLSHGDRAADETRQVEGRWHELVYLMRSLCRAGRTHVFLVMSVCTTSCTTVSDLEVIITHPSRRKCENKVIKNCPVCIVLLRKLGVPLACLFGDWVLQTALASKQNHPSTWEFSSWNNPQEDRGLSNDVGSN